MSSQVDPDDTVAVSADGIAVEKSFAADEFPVPAIRFAITSNRDETVTVRLSEDIPAEFPMDGVGFHPDYDSENWTAFQDHHVEYERTLDPGEEVVTVYGIRIESQSDVPQFLTEPRVSEVDGPAAGEADADDENTLDDIADDDSNQVVKDMISGDSEGVPGLDDEDGSPADDSSEDASAIDLDLGSAEAELDAGADDEGAADEGDAETAEDDGPEIELNIDEQAAAGDAGSSDDSAPELDLTDDSEEDAEADAVAEADETDDEAVADDGEDEPVESDDEAGADDEVGETVDSDDEAVVGEPAVTPSDTAAALAAAVREDEVAEDDLAAIRDALEGEDAGSGVDEADVVAPGAVADALVDDLEAGSVGADTEERLREALDVAVPGTDIAKVEHLQSRVEELAAYTDALEEFLDEEGTANQLLEEYNDQVSALQDDVRSIQSAVGEHDEVIEAIEGDVDELGDESAEAHDRINALEGEVTGLEDDLETTREDLEVATDDIAADVDAVSSDVDALEATVDDHVEEFTGRVDDIEADVTDIEMDVTDIDEDVEALRTDVDELEAEITEIHEWRDQLGEMFS